jgi:hypothetical protein
MPADILQKYATSGATTQGLEAEYKRLVDRIEAFKAMNLFDRFAAVDFTADDIWHEFIASPEELTEERVLARLEELEKKKHQPGMVKRGAGALAQAAPGVGVAQWLVGKNGVTGQDIDRFSWKSLALLAASGISTLTAIRGVGNLKAGWRAASAGMPALVGAGYAKQGDSAAVAAVIGDNSFVQRSLSMIPFTGAHRKYMALGHLEGAAKMLNEGGLEALQHQTDDGYLVTTGLSQLMDDIKSGALGVSVRGPRNGYLGPIMPRVLQPQVSPITYGLDKNGKGVLTLAGNLRAGRPDQVLAALAGVAGKRMEENPAWLQASPEMAEYLEQLSPIERQGLSDLMSASVSRSFGASMPSGRINSVVGRIKKGPSQYFEQLERKTTDTPEWYAHLNRSIRDRVELRTAGGNVAGEVTADAAPASIEGIVADTADDAGSIASQADDVAPMATVDPVDVAPAASGQIEVVRGYRPGGAHADDPASASGQFRPSRYIAAMNGDELETFARRDLVDPSLFT